MKNRIRLKLSAINDEIANELDEQVSTLLENDIHNIEIRKIRNEDILNSSHYEIKKCFDTLKNNNISVSALDTPIGKISIHEPFEKQFFLFQRYVEIAHMLSTSNIRVFSFLFKEDDKKSDYLNEVVSRLGCLVEYAQIHDVTLLLENDVYTLCDNVDICKKILQIINNNKLKLLFDLGNFLRNDIVPYPKAYQTLEDYIGYIHIKDIDSVEKKYLPYGHGDCNIADMLTYICINNSDKFVSLEPHLYFGADNSEKREAFSLACDSLMKLISRREV